MSLHFQIIIKMLSLRNLSYLKVSSLNLPIDETVLILLESWSSSLHLTCDLDRLSGLINSEWFPHLRTAPEWSSMVWDLPQLRLLRLRNLKSSSLNVEVSFCHLANITEQWFLSYSRRCFPWACCLTVWHCFGTCWWARWWGRRRYWVGHDWKYVLKSVFHSVAVELDNKSCKFTVVLICVKYRVIFALIIRPYLLLIICLYVFIPEAPEKVMIYWPVRGCPFSSPSVVVTVISLHVYTFLPEGITKGSDFLRANLSTENEENV